MNYTNIKQVSMLDNFQIIGEWGIDQNNLKYNGSLIHNEDGIHLFLYTLGIKTNLNDINKIYGQGTLILKNGDQYSNFFTNVTLEGTTFINESTTFSTDVSSHKFFEISVSFMYVGSHFIQDDTKLYNTNIYLTNFNNWLTYPIPTFSGNEDDSEKMWMYSFPNPNKFKMYKKKINKSNFIRLRYDLKGINPHNNTSFNLSGKIFGFTIVNNLVIEGQPLVINDVIKYSNNILSWYSLVANKREMISNIIANTKDDKYISIFKGGPFKIPSENKKIHVQTHRDDKFINNMMESLKRYLSDSKKLSPIFNQGVNLNNYGTIDQQAHFACTMLEVINDNFYEKDIKKYKDKHHVSKVFFQNKVKMVMADIDDSLIDAVMKKMHIKNYFNFIREIRDIRNNTSHSYFDVDNKDNYMEVAFMMKALHIIIREWLLLKIGVNKEYIENENNISDLVNLEVE